MMQRMSKVGKRNLEWIVKVTLIYLMNERVVKRFFADNIINECEWELSTERKDNLSVLEIILISSTKSGQHKRLQK